MKKHSIILFILTGLIVQFFTACSSGTDMKTDPAETYSLMTDDFMIIGYSGPPEGEVNLERYQEVADAGIEILVPGNGTMNGEQNLRALDLAEQVGIKIIPLDIRIMPFSLAPEVEIDTAIIHAVVKDYKEHPAMAAYVIRDEPNAELFPSLGKLSALIREQDSIHEPLINLFPSYGSPVQLGFEDYRSYISTYIETVKPGLLSYDNYALREGVTWYDAWYKDLKIVREETWKAGIPFIVFMQSQGIKEGMRVPNRAEILWQVNTALSFGARGVGWFSYWTPQPDQGLNPEGDTPFLVESHYNAMIDLQGERTEVYNYVKEANFYLKKAGKGLLAWEHTEVSRWEAGSPVDGKESLYVKPQGENANVVVGAYRNQEGKSILLAISNASCEERSTFNLELMSGWQFEKVFASIDANPAGEQEDLSDWKLEPGGSVIIELMQKP